MIPVLALGGADSFDWAREFRPFTPFHWITSGTCAALIVASCILGSRWRATARERRLRLAWAGFVFLVQAVVCVYFIAEMGVSRGLPFQICDLAGWVAGVALLTRARTARVILYYWGIVLSTQAFVTPIIQGTGSGYMAPYYWAFWLQHLTIVGSAVYEVVVLRFRPTWRDCAFAVAVTSAWVAVMFVFNRAMGTNYVFVGPSTPNAPTILDALGPYPWRVLWIAAIAISAFAVSTGVWADNRRRTPGPPAAAAG